jgi:predicted small metal-binding protein
MRAVDCPCGITLTGNSDEEVLRLAFEHRDQHHANDNIPDEFVRETVATGARDITEGATTSAPRQP